MTSQKWSLNQSLKDELKGSAETQEELSGRGTAWTQRLEDMIDSTEHFQKYKDVSGGSVCLCVCVSGAGGMREAGNEIKKIN